MYFTRVKFDECFALIPARGMRFRGPDAIQQKWSIPRLMMSPCNETWFSTLVTGKFGNIWIATSIVNFPCSAQKKWHVLVDVLASIDRRTDHICFFSLNLGIASPFAVCKKKSMLTEWGQVNSQRAWSCRASEPSAVIMLVGNPIVAHLVKNVLFPCCTPVSKKIFVTTPTSKVALFVPLNFVKMAARAKSEDYT